MSAQDCFPQRPRVAYTGSVVLNGGAAVASEIASGQLRSSRRSRGEFHVTAQRYVRRVPSVTAARGSMRIRSGVIASLAALLTTVIGKAADFGAVRYDPKSDQIIVTMTYDGTNPNHHFSIHWGPCRKREDPWLPTQYFVDVNILDDQGDDAAKQSYTETVRVPLVAISCRPVTVTLWTPPGLYSPAIDIAKPPTVSYGY